ncbi:MAG: threonine/serine exporter family protein [Oscillospiraceae bacterium]|nr:threonine/serine exporter family protein [Oscillospiraceae bacterium]
MDKTRHPDWLLVLTYAVMAFSRAGRDFLSFNDMLICGFSGVVLGIVVVMAEKLKLPVYICRGMGAFFASLVIIEICFFTGWADSSVMTVIASMIPPVAAGAMLVEGLSTSHRQSGRKKIINAILISVFLALAVFLAVAFTKFRGVPVITW